MPGEQCSPVRCLRIVGQICSEQWDVPEPGNRDKGQGQEKPGAEGARTEMSGQSHFLRTNGQSSVTD